MRNVWCCSNFVPGTLSEPPTQVTGRPSVRVEPQVRLLVRGPAADPQRDPLPCSRNVVEVGA